MTNTDLTPAEQARKYFVDNYKKVKKIYLESLAEELDSPDRNDEEIANLLLRVIIQVDAPAAMWDISEEGERETLWIAMVLCTKKRAEEMKSESEKMLDKHNELYNLDPNEDKDLDDSFGNSLAQGLTQGSPQVTALDTDDDDDDDDDDVLPKFIYHASPGHNLQAIQTDGLKPMGRSFVHLHADKQKAIDIAKRHGDTDIVLFQVDAEDFRSSGVYFAKKDLGYGEIFLASEVHPKYLHEIDE